MKNNILIAVTGGIGSGKSTALKIIKEAGYKTFSCDEECKKLYKKREVKLKIKEIFPNAVKGEKRLLVDKKIISKEAFSNERAYKNLSDFMTEKTWEKTFSLAKRHKGKVFIEVPLLFENSMQKYFDKIIVVLRDKKSRIESVKKRSNLTESEINLRISKQFDYDKDLSDYVVIKNDSDFDSLKKKILEVIK